MDSIGSILFLCEIGFRLLGVIGALLLIIFVHEMGHYLVGRWRGIGASVFSIGFGPEICHFIDKRGTRWRLAAIPLGGYVKFVGNMEAVALPKQAWNEEDLQGHSFPSASIGSRMLTVFAGPFFNIILTFLILSSLFFFYGRTQFAPIIAEIVPGSPAQQAGLKLGDRFLSVNGHKVEDFSEIVTYIMLNGDDEVDFTVDRQGETIALTARPQIERVDDGFGHMIKVPRLGVKAAMNEQSLEKIDYSLFQSIAAGFGETIGIIQQTGRFISKFFQGKGDRCQLSGPVRSAELAWKISDFGFVALLHLTALFSASIAIFNLFPIPPLDGGHLLFYILEVIIGKPVPLKIQQLAFRVGITLVFAFMAFTIVNNSVPC